MKKSIFFPTNNIGKYERYSCSFKNAGITYNRYFNTSDGEPLTVDVDENCKTAKENAEKKALAYYEEYKKIMPQTDFVIMTTDESLYIDGLKDEEQPKERVRRFNGLTRATDMQVVEQYTNFVKKLGGKAKAKWHYSLVAYDGNKFHYLDWDEPVEFSDTPHEPIPKGYVLNSITIVDKDEKGNDIMLSDLSPEKRQSYLALYTDKVADFINSIYSQSIDEKNYRD